MEERHKYWEINELSIALRLQLCLQMGLCEAEDHEHHVLPPGGQGEMFLISSREQRDS